MRMHNHINLGAAWIALCLILVTGVVIPVAAVSAEKISPSLLSEVVTKQASQLAAIDSDASALALFTTTVGPSLGLRDAAGALGAKGLPAKLAKELGIAELSLTVHQLMAALAAEQFADLMSHADDSPTTTSAVLPPATRQDWMKGSSRVASLTDLFRALQEQQAADTAQPVSQSQRTALLLAANRVAFEANQRATTAWWELHQWKDRIRQVRGQARLCGTWQWIIHNHQKHQEQKVVMLFPPAGHEPANAPLPAETVVLGDSVYLRWEQKGQIQEDSLLFIKDGTRIEGSFINNTGGWGSITGKRTADCQP